jgi:four helix bundle protein
MEVGVSKSPIQPHRDVLVWQKAMELAEACYKLTSTFPREEMYGLVSQMRRAAVSILSTMAEGFGRDSTGSFVQHLRIAQGSLKELETQLTISHRVGCCVHEMTAPLIAMCDEIGRMLRSLIRSLQDQ